MVFPDAWHCRYNTQAATMSTMHHAPAPATMCTKQHTGAHRPLHLCPAVQWHPPLLAVPCPQVPPPFHRAADALEGCAAVRPTWHRQDAAGQGSSHRVPHHLLQHQRQQPYEQMEGGLGEDGAGEWQHVPLQSTASLSSQPRLHLWYTKCPTHASSTLVILCCTLTIDAACTSDAILAGTFSIICVITVGHAPARRFCLSWHATTHLPPFSWTRWMH